MKVLITSGGCKVPIDDVRHIGNFSSGRYGRELAEVFLDAGHEVIFFMESGSQQPNSNLRGERYTNITKVSYKYYDEYLLVKDLIKREQPDIIISAAAISDYIVNKTEGKISSNEDEIIITLKKSEKVLNSFKELAPTSTIIGFKLLVSPSEEEKYNAIKKQFDYVDHVVYNDLTELRAGNSVRELIYWAEENKICSHKLDVGRLVTEILESHAVTSIFKKLKLKG